MKTIALALFPAVFAFAQAHPTTAQPAPVPVRSTIATKAPVKKAKPSDPHSNAHSQTQTIPADAKLVEPNLYRYTDSNGKTWNYKQTPFGVSRWEETSGATPAAAPAAAPQAKNDPVVVTDLGDSYRFERKTPFGHSSWTRKKTELSDEEKGLAGAQQSNPNVNAKPAGNQ